MNPWVEKLLFAVIPVLISGVIYLFSTVIALQTDLMKMQDDAAIARYLLKEEIRDEVKQNATNIAVLTEQVKHLQDDQ
jgi:hypothetical protein